MTDNTHNQPEHKEQRLVSPHEEHARLVEIDTSARWPVLFFFTAGIFWLFLAALLGIAANIKFRYPELLDFLPYLTFGRLKPAFHHVLIYGWAFSASFGTMLWVMARTCKCRIPFPLLVTVVGHIWHLGVFVGLAGIILGMARPYEWLEMPTAAAGILLFAYVFIALWGFVILALRDGRGKVFISALYLIAALLWFPWVFGTANLMLASGKLIGVMQPIVNWWYVDALVGLWFTPVALGAAYFLVPKITGNPLSHYKLSYIAFWGIALFNGWLGMRHLAGSPIPAWLTTVSLFASVMMIIPAAIVMANLIPPLMKGSSTLENNIGLRFIAFGLAAFLVMNTFGALFQFRTFAKFTQFTVAIDAYLYLAIYAFPSMIFFGVIYYTFPRILGVAWHMPSLVALHYWISLFSVVFLVIFMFAGGLFQGNVLNEADNYMTTVMYQAQLTAQVADLFWLAIAFSNFIFLINFLLSLLDVFDPTKLLLDFVQVDESPDQEEHATA